MKISALTIFLSLNLIFLSSCVERQTSRPPTHKSNVKKPMNSNSKAINKTAFSSKTNSSGYVQAKGYNAGLLRNLDITREDLDKIIAIKRKWNEKIVEIPKGPDGRRDKVKVGILHQKKQDDLKKYLGPATFKKYIKYTAWFNKQK